MTFTLRACKNRMKKHKNWRMSMKRLVEFPLEEGGSILVQIDEETSGGTVRAGRDEVIEKARETLEEALNRVLPAAKSVVEKLQSMSSKPDEIEVNFGINLRVVVQRSRIW
jgi:NTP-dependent ternary system trypsin peptidase co-occuring protein